METNFTNNELQSLNIFERLQLLRIDIQKANLKQSGYNKFANYKYFDLKDIIPTINILLLKYKLTTHITFTNDIATLTIINCHKPDEKIIFTRFCGGYCLKKKFVCQIKFFLEMFLND